MEQTTGIREAGQDLVPLKAGVQRVHRTTARGLQGLNSADFDFINVPYAKHRLLIYCKTFLCKRDVKMFMAQGRPKL